MPKLEARVGIEHQFMFNSYHRNSQQHKPLRSFLNVFNPLIRALWLQELFRQHGSTIINPTLYYCGTIILLELLLEVDPVELHIIIFF